MAPISRSYVETFVAATPAAQRLVRAAELGLANTFVRRNTGFLCQAEILRKQVRMAVWQAAEAESVGRRGERDKLLFFGRDLVLQLEDLVQEARMEAEAIPFCQRPTKP